ncbi:DUF2804 domain-containing protein [Desulfobotulus sp. H1]|uniref:DUF2804 domain-containing protein n=1 Tax=Desulfobotulus pelophilus TaxID=2823377 RepID=A0ABT3N814_9BACT|nr:DUF2804 domain-containing protein [Desulfobotulus pelophilus]MCW7753589.1 DUF2804 domain-containing protein [Desulfobotulus pelophilus]
MALIICPETGKARYGRHLDRVHINLNDYRFLSAMGTPLPRVLMPLRYRQFVFIGLSDKDFCAGIALADLKFAQQAFFYARHASGRIVVQAAPLCLFPRRSMNGETEFPDFSFDHATLSIRFALNRLQVSCGNALLDVVLGEAASPLRLCTPTGRQGWTFTRKAASIPVEGRFSWKDESIELSASSCRAITDRTGGFLRRETFWNWASASCLLPDGREFGMNLAWGVNETGFTENRIWLNGSPTDFGPVIFHVPKNRHQDSWRIHTENQSIDLLFTPSWTMAHRMNILLLATDFVQNTGHFSGYIRLPDQSLLRISATPGWTEDHYVRW